MAKESMKARERKDKRWLQNISKRKSLKDAKDYIGLQKLPKMHLQLDFIIDVS